jgi:hypothetical protein
VTSESISVRPATTCFAGCPAISNQEAVICSISFCLTSTGWPARIALVMPEILVSSSPALQDRHEASQSREAGHQVRAGEGACCGAPSMSR